MPTYIIRGNRGKPLFHSYSPGLKNSVNRIEAILEEFRGRIVDRQLLPGVGRRQNNTGAGPASEKCGVTAHGVNDHAACFQVVGEQLK